MRKTSRTEAPLDGIHGTVTITGGSVRIDVAGWLAATRDRYTVVSGAQAEPEVSNESRTVALSDGTRITFASVAPESELT